MTRLRAGEYAAPCAGSHGSHMCVVASTALAHARVRTVGYRRGARGRADACKRSTARDVPLGWAVGRDRT